MSSPTRRVLTGIALFVSVVLIGEAGYVIAGWSPGDALYMVVITIFGVGYGEVRPVTSWELRTFTILVIMAGYGAVLYTAGGLLQSLVDGELNRHLGERRMNRDIDRLEGHAIICGYGRMGQSLARDLARAGSPFVAVDVSEENLRRSDDKAGHLYLVGDATEERILEQAGIGRAAVLATVLSDDALNVFVTLSAHAMNSDLRIIARGEQPSTIDKLHRCGADHVISPTTIGAAKMSQLITQPTADQILATGNLDFANLGLAVSEVEVTKASASAGLPLAEVRVHGRHDHLVIALRRSNGSAVVDPPSDTVIEMGDRLVVVGYHDDEPLLTHRSGATVYRGVRNQN